MKLLDIPLCQAEKQPLLFYLLLSQSMQVYSLSSISMQIKTFYAFVCYLCMQKETYYLFFPSRLKGDVFPSMFGKGPEKQMLEEMAYSVSKNNCKAQHSFTCVYILLYFMLFEKGSLIKIYLSEVTHIYLCTMKSI